MYEPLEVTEYEKCGKVIAEQKELIGEIRMQKPNLNQMWETFIKIGLEVHYGSLCDMIRFQIHPVISDLRQKKIIDWYCFLIHNRESGVPTTKDDNNAYWHIRFELKQDMNPKDFLPKYCVMTRKVKLEWVADISITKTEVMDKSLFKNGKIEEAWRIIGEQSEWLLNLLDIYKEDVKITPKQILPFLHYYANMTQLQVR